MDRDTIMKLNITKTEKEDKSKTEITLETNQNAEFKEHL